MASVPSTNIDAILLSCGSFNPPTIMHLRMFELARDHLRTKTGYRAVKGILSPVNDRYGKKGLISEDHRITMLRLATSDSNWLCVDDWEATQDDWCRTVVVLRRMQDKYKQRIMLLCGADLLMTFNVPGIWNPEDVEEMVREYGIVVITRTGTDLRDVISKSAVLTRYQENIHIVTENMTNEISSTKIREALQNGESVRYFVPDLALAYINEHRLYGVA